MKKVNILIILAVVLGFSACQKKPDIGGTTTQKFANEWWVELYDPSGTAVTPVEHIKTYNTAANDNTFWIDDFPVISTSGGPHWTGNIWAFKFKANADLNNLTFSANQAASDLSGKSGTTQVDYKIKVNVTNGKIIENGGHSKTNVVVDSIFMNIEFSDDPGTIYSIRGHGRTGFFEDEY
jgi:hypothetical protein